MLQMCFYTSYEQNQFKSRSATIHYLKKKQKNNPKPPTNKIDTFAQFYSNMITFSLKNSCFLKKSPIDLFPSFYIPFPDLLTIIQLLSYF